MNYLVLDGPPYQVSYPVEFYRGTERRDLVHCDAVPDDHEINRLFAWYLDQVYESGNGVVHDLVKALRYAELCNQYFPERRFEVIEITKGTARPKNTGQFLGFDISKGGCGDSLVFQNVLPRPDTALPKEPASTLSKLVRDFFHPRFNQFGLFQAFEDAVYCHHVMIALHSFAPEVCCGDPKDFEVVGIYLVPNLGGSGTGHEAG